MSLSDKDRALVKLLTSKYTNPNEWYKDINADFRRRSPNISQDEKDEAIEVIKTLESSGIIKKITADIMKKNLLNK